MHKLLQNDSILHPKHPSCEDEISDTKQSVGERITLSGSTHFRMLVITLSIRNRSRRERSNYFTLRLRAHANILLGVMFGGAQWEKCKFKMRNYLACNTVNVLPCMQHCIQSLLQKFSLCHPLYLKDSSSPPSSGKVWIPLKAATVVIEPEPDDPHT